MPRIIFSCMILLSLLACNGNNDRIYPVRKPITESVYASVTIQPDSLYQAFAIISGILEKNLVEEGREVKKGEPIIQITNNSPKLNTENARLALELARENYEGRATVLGGIKDEIEAANLRLKNDSINFTRQERLWEQKIGSQAQYDARKLAYQLSSNQLNLLKNKYDQTENDLLTRLHQAENNYRNSLINTSDFTIKSKINGKIYALYKNEGEIVTPTQPLAALGKADKFIAEMLVDEVDIVEIQNKQKVLLNLDAYPGEIFTARISKIYPKKDERNQTFKVEAEFDDPPDVLYPGLSGEANIIVAEKDSALVIPRPYLTEDGRVKTEDSLIKVIVGLKGIDSVEVLSGIDRNTPIYKPKE